MAEGQEMPTTSSKDEEPGFERIPYGVLSKVIDDAYNFARMTSMLGEWSPKGNPLHMLAYIIFVATGRMDDQVEVTPDGKIVQKDKKSKDDKQTQTPEG